MIGSKEARDKFLAQLSLDNCMKETKAICEGFPWRLTGTKAAHDAGRYVVDTLKVNGVNAELLEFTGYLNIPEKAYFSVTAPETREIGVMACAQCGSTPEEGIEGELVWIGNGGEADYAGKDVTGKIVLAELSYAPPRPEKTRLAMVHGAAGLICMNWGPDDNPLNTNGTVKPVWGNPTPETIHLMENTPPVIGMPRLYGCELRDRLLAGEKITGRMKVHATRDWLKGYLPQATIKAPNGDGDFVLIAAHMDSWAQGASDNASGNAIKMELARVFEKNKELLKHDVRIAFWQGHENGIMEGSTWFCEKFWDELDEHCIAYLIYDTAGLERASVWRADSTSETVAWHKAVENAVIPDMPKERNKGMRTGDNSFFGLGIPSISCWAVHTREEIKAWNNATLGIWYHSDADTMEHIDRDVMEVCMRMYGAYAWELATAPVYPMTFDLVADDIIDRIQRLIDLTKNRPDSSSLLELDAVMEAADEFKKTALEFRDFTIRAFNGPAGADTVFLNQVIKKVSREINAVKLTVSGRFEQDTYGLSALNHELPGTDAIDTLVSFPPDSHDYYLWSTRARRERNKVTDALRHASWLMKLVLD